MTVRQQTCNWSETIRTENEFFSSMLCTTYMLGKILLDQTDQWSKQSWQSSNDKKKTHSNKWSIRINVVLIWTADELEVRKINTCCICNKLFTHKNDIPSVTVQATITFMNPLTFSSFIQSCNTCEILQNTNCSSKFSCAYFPTLFNRHIFPRLVLVSCFTARGAATYFPVLGAGHIFSRS